MAAINQIHYNSNTANQTNNGSAAQLAATAGIVGAGVGTACGIIKKVPIKNTNGKINDAFTKSVYNRYVKNTTDETLKQFENQRLNIIQNIKGINTKEELKKLLSDNEEFVNEAFASSNKKNKFFAQFPLFSIKTRKKNILESIENAHKLRLDNISNAIIDCLNGTKGTLTKANSVSDELLFKNIIDYIDKNSKQKLFIMTKTASSHVPFDSPWGSDNFDNSFLYTDHAIDNFIKDLEKRDYFKNGIVVITGDHQPWGYAEGGNKNSIFSRYHVPLIVIGQDYSKTVDHTMFSHSSLGVYLQGLMLGNYKLNKFNADPINSQNQPVIMAYEFDKQIFAMVKQDDKEARIKFDGDNTQFMNKIFDNEFEHDVLGFLASCSL